MTINIEIFSSPGCSKCDYAKETLKKMVAELGENKVTWRSVNIINEIDYAVSLKILSTPSIAINGDVVFTSLPSAKKLKNKIDDYLIMNAKDQ